MNKVNSILVVDDDVASLLTLADILQSDYKVSTVKDSSEALALLDEQHYDLLLLDVVMPGMDGFEVLSKLKESKRTENIPTMFITGAESFEEKGLALGAADYIHKPFDRTVVKHRIDNQMKMLTLNRELEYNAENATKLALIARAANLSKSSFIAQMSHELSTPLEHIVKVTDKLMKNNDFPADVFDDLTQVSSYGNLLIGFLNDLLDFSRLEAKMVEISTSQYELVDMLNKVIDHCLSYAKTKPITFNLNVDENLPTVLLGDEPRIRKIFRHLLINAFKYTEEGEVTLSVSGDFRGDGLFLVANFIDTGCGMSSEQLDTLYTEYVRFHRSSELTEGVGLGMPIVKHLLDLMHGNISVRSEVDRGTAFTVRIPQRYVGNATIGTNGIEKLKSHNP